MMKLREIFEKPVDRAIEGVIKADDEASLRMEIEEYVMTNEIEKRLEKFLMPTTITRQPTASGFPASLAPENPIY